MSCLRRFASGWIASPRGFGILSVWLPCLMITGQANRQSFKCLLAGSHDWVGACDMPDH
jgi:hypothetical protein